MAATCLRRDSRWGGLCRFCCRHPRSQTLVPGTAGEGETEGPPNTLTARMNATLQFFVIAFLFLPSGPDLPADDVKHDWRGGEGKGEGMGKRKGSKDLAAALSVVYAKSLQSCPTLTLPVDGSPPGSPIPGILQARTLEWVAMSFSNA